MTFERLDTQRNNLMMTWRGWVTSTCEEPACGDLFGQTLLSLNVRDKSSKAALTKSVTYLRDETETKSTSFDDVIVAFLVFVVE